MAKRVAVDGTVVAIPGAVPFPGAQNGTWTAMPVQYTTDPKIKTGGKPVITKAQCTFMFAGVGPAPAFPAVNGQEKVTLSAKKTKLQKQVLVEGDMIMSPYGNQLKVVAVTKIKTT